MEEVIELDQWLQSYSPAAVEYIAVFDPTTGSIHAVGSKNVLSHHETWVDIDQETAELIIEGRISLNSCSVDVTGTTFKMSETRSVYSIDDVLHRIPEVGHTDNDRHNLYLTYSKDLSELTIELTEEYGGTKTLPDQYQPVSVKSIKWVGTTDMNFLITSYNDPNVIYDMFTIQIQDIVGKALVIKGFDLPEKFSVYTRRLFKNYIIEYK